jgi:hypothetical protein
MSRAAARLAAETAAFMASEKARDAARSSKAEYQAAEASRIEQPEDSCLLECTTRDLREDLHAAFGMDDALLPRDQHSV